MFRVQIYNDYSIIQNLITSITGIEKLIPDNPSVTGLNYCQGAGANQLTANILTGHNSVWYSSSSGEVSGVFMKDWEALAKRRGLNLMVTTFNGGYIGYITPDEYYDYDYHEARGMNWYGPYNGAYFNELINGLMSSGKSCAFALIANAASIRELKTTFFICISKGFLRN